MLRIELSSDQVLDLMRVPENKNVYFVGARARKVSFWAQQNRALNLVWALKEKHKLNNNERCAVVGGGLAGMTAAAALLAEGVPVTIFERRHKFMHLQQENFQRYLHPRIAEWPGRGAIHNSADLPCLQWSDGLAAEVVDEIWQQWRGLEEKIESWKSPDKESTLTVHTGHEVLNVSFFEDESPILRYRNRANLIKEERFSTVIIAIGFGLEKGHSVTRSLSYWDNDNLTRPVLRAPIPRSYLVTGAGDGGLIDAVRLRLDGFAHTHVTWLISGMFIRNSIDNQLNEENESLFRQQLELESRLRKIDQEAENMKNDVTLMSEYHRRLTVHRVEDWDENLKKRVWEDLQADFIHHRYEQLVSRPLIEGANPNLLLELEKFISKRQREDTNVALNHPTSTPLTLKSSILNRWTAFLFMKFGGLRTIGGRCSIKGEYDGKVAVEFERVTHDSKHAENFDEVVIRQGPESPLVELFGRKIANHFSANTIDKPDVDKEFEASGEPQYDSDFSYGVRQLTQVTRLEDMEYLRLRSLHDPCERALNVLVPRVLESFPDFAHEFRCCIWAPSVLDPELLFMVTRYFPLRNRFKRMHFILGFNSNTGLIGQAFNERAFRSWAMPGVQSNAEYELEMVKTWHISTEQSTHLYSNKRGMFAYPLIRAGTCFGIVYGDFQSPLPIQIGANRLLELCDESREDMLNFIEGTLA